MYDYEPEPWIWRCPDYRHENVEEDAPDFGKLLVCEKCGYKVIFGEYDD